MQQHCDTSGLNGRAVEAVALWGRDVHAATAVTVSVHSTVIRLHSFI